MSIYELKILFDLNPESKLKVLDKHAKQFRLNFFSPNYFFVDSEDRHCYFFVDSEDGHCYVFDRYGKERDVSLVYEITEFMIPKDIKKIVIPDGITSIGDFAFSICSFTSVIIPDSAMYIGSYAFAGCSNLINAIAPNNVWYIGHDAFYKCSNLKSLVFKNKTLKQVKSMENYPFGIKDESIIKAELS